MSTNSTPTCLPTLATSDLDRDNPDALICKIRPTQRDAEGNLYWLEDLHPHNDAINWGNRHGERAEGLTVLATIETFHTYGYHGFFKPSLAEVLAQIPAEYHHEAVAFSIAVAGDGNPALALVGDYHVGETTLYRQT